VFLKRALLVACVATLAPKTTGAARYEMFIDVETEEDLYDLLVTRQISETSFDALLLLHQTRVELNRASRERLYLLPNLDYADVDRILGYREAVEAIRAVGDLVGAGVLSQQLADSLRAFVSVRARDVPEDRVEGFVRAQLRWTGRHDRLPPAAAIQARLRAAHNLDSGMVGSLTRNHVWRTRWDAARGGLSVEPESVRFEVPKAYIEWEDDRWEIVGGTYRIGFGQRLTFDVTDQVTPNGLFGDYELRRDNELGLRCRRGAGELHAAPCPEARVARVTPDFTWTNRLTGVGAGMKQLPLGSGWLQAYVWGSYQLHRLGASAVRHAGWCSDPRDDDDPGCAPPPVYARTGDIRAPLATVAYARLPAVVGEGLAGANASYFWNARTQIGLTGYGAVPKWRVDGVELDFQEHAAKPSGGAFGAIGVNAAVGFHRQDFFAEVARSFDRQAGGGGGYGAIARSVTTLDAGEVEVSARYYGPRYANPYARPISAPDERDGLRARDEAGLRIRAATGLGPRLELRALGDAWVSLSSTRLNAMLFGRIDLRISDSWTWASWAEHRIASHKTLLATVLGFNAIRRVALSWQLQHRWREASLVPSRRQRDLVAIFDLRAHPIDLLRLRMRLRYDFEDLFDNHRLPQTLWVYLDTAFTTRERDTLRLRYDLRAHLDERVSTLRRVPNPEHWLWVEYLFRY
jgi:DNA uptake protein ComE-like DNA-binding protein